MSMMKAIIRATVPLAILIWVPLSVSADNTHRLAGSFYLGETFGIYSNDHSDNGGGFTYGGSVGFHPRTDWSACLSVDSAAFPWGAHLKKLTGWIFDCRPPFENL